MPADSENAEAEPARPRVVVVGGGFGGYFATRVLIRKLRGHDVDLTLVSDTDGLLYAPLLPDVAVGAVDSRAIAVPLVTTLTGAFVLRGRASSVDVDRRVVEVDGAEGRTHSVAYDHLLLAPGAVTRLLDIPGLADHAIGLKTAAEALFLRDHVLGRMETANATTDATARRAALTFVVVGAGYAGTELAAQMARVTRNLLPAFANLGADDISWLLVDVAPAVMPELGQGLGDTALQLLRRRGVDVRLETSVQEITDSTVTLTDGTHLDCSTVVWCAGVTGNPLIESLGLPTSKGRLVVDATLSVPQHPEILAIGDAAAVPDLTADTRGTDDQPVCPPTAQHAMRQGPAAARNIVAALAGKPPRLYRHHDLGLVVDLGGWDAAARPLGVSLRGVPAKLVTRGYHLYALPTAKRRTRVVVDWLLAGKRPDDVSLGLMPMQSALAVRAEHQP